MSFIGGCEDQRSSRAQGPRCRVWYTVNQLCLLQLLWCAWKQRTESDSWLCRYLNRAAFLSANGMWLPIPPLLCSKVLKIVSKIRDNEEKKKKKKETYETFWWLLSLIVASREQRKPPSLRPSGSRRKTDLGSWSLLNSERNFLG